MAYEYTGEIARIENVLVRIADALESIAASLQARDEEAQRIITQLRDEASWVLTEVEEEMDNDD